MNVGVLWSGGKDSSLAALLLSQFATVELVSVSFGIVPNDAPSHAHKLGFRHTAIELEEAHAMKAVDTMIIDGYANNGINLIHEIALEHAAEQYETIADGTRRDDKVPRLSVGEAQRLENRYGVNYVRPLLGCGRHIIDVLVEAHFEVVYGEGVGFDYERELRDIMTTVYGSEAVNNVFPAHHVQSKVTARKTSNTLKQA